jgi:hypothetical protein
MRRFIVCTLIAFGLAAVLAGAAGAATTIVTPGDNPYHAQLDAKGNVVPFTVVASGFQPDANVYAEVCNARVPSDPHWRPQVDCDLGSAPAPAIADAHGKVTFTAGDPNSQILFFHGESPEHIFNCLTASEPSPKNHVDDYRSCQVRVSTNNADATADQVFLKYTLGGSGTSTSSKGTIALVVVGIAVVAVIAVVLISRRRSSVSG